MFLHRKISRDAQISILSCLKQGILKISTTTKINDFRYTGPHGDIWSLGATLYMTVVGRQPWVAKDYMQLSYKVQNDELTFPKQITLDPHL